MAVTDLALYSPARARKLSWLLWGAVVIALLFAGLATWVLIAEDVPRVALLAILASLVLLVSAARTLALMKTRGRAARFGVILTGLLLIVTGLFVPGALAGLVALVLGLFLLLLAVLPDVGDH